MATRNPPDHLIAAINRLTSAIEQLNLCQGRLGETGSTRYTRVRTEQSHMISEDEMAAVLDIRPRTLGDHRRMGKLPGCWIKNGKRVLYDRDQTLAVWKRGLP